MRHPSTKAQPLAHSLAHPLARSMAHFMANVLTLLVALAIAVLAASRLAAAGEIYCNNQGRDCSDRPTPNSVPVHVANPPPSAANEPAPGGTPKPPPVDTISAQLKDQASRQAVDKDMANRRADDCKQAKEKYEQAITAHRIYKLGKDGEREYLSDAELDQARLNARLQMDRSCSPSGS